MTYGNSLLANNYGYGYSSFGSSYGNYGYGGYGGYGYGNVGNVEGAKTNIKNQYDIYAARQSYSNMQNVEGMNYAQKSEVIAELLRTNRGQEALKQFKGLCGDLKSSGLYGEYSNSQIKALAMNIYQGSTGENFLEAINKNSNSAFTTGLRNGVPLVGFFSSSISKDDARAQVTNVEQSWKSVVAEKTGALTGGATFGAGVGIALKVLNAAKKNGGKEGFIIGIGRSVSNVIKNPESLKKLGKWGGIAAGIFAAIGLAQSFFKTDN